MGLLLHEPLLVDSVCPCTVEPLTTGTAVFAGAGGKVTTAVSADAAEVEPAELPAVTETRTVSPTSLLVSV